MPLARLDAVSVLLLQPPLFSSHWIVTVVTRLHCLVCLHNNCTGERMSVYFTSHFQIFQPRTIPNLDYIPRPPLDKQKNLTSSIYLFVMKLQIPLHPQIGISLYHGGAILPGCSQEGKSLDSQSIMVWGSCDLHVTIYTYST